MADSAAEISLRPLSLKTPAGAPANPFSGFGKGLGFARAKHSALIAAPADDLPPKKSGDRIKYPKEFLMKFMNEYTKCPPEVEQMNMLDIVVSGEDQKEAQKEALAKVAEDIDDRDWRTRAPIAARDFDAYEREAPPSRPVAVREVPKEKPSQKDVPDSRAGDQRPAAAAAAPAPSQQEQTRPQVALQTPVQPRQQPSYQQSRADQDLKKAEESGRQAYKVGGTLSNEERAIRSVKGILNKLTPEKFERLLNQLLEVITTAEILQQTISLLFENAVEQPTYCALYSDLCVRLSTELPSFPPPPGADKPITFKQILLNTCFDEFYGAEEARERAAGISERLEQEAAERAVKKRVTGTMRLMSELYKKDMVKDSILTTCVDELLAARTRKGDKVPPESNIEAVCEILTLSGERLEKSDKPATLRQLERALKELERLSKEKDVQSRVRFLIKDVLELKHGGWVHRKEMYMVKKLDEVRAQAEAELGMISSSIAAALPQLPAAARFEAAAAGRATGGGLPGMGGAGGLDEFVLLPPLRSDDSMFPAFKGDGAGFLGKSALLGEWTQPVQRPAAAPAAVAPQSQPPARGAAAAAGGAQQGPPAPAVRPAPPAASGQELSEDDLKRKCVGLFEEYCSTLDVNEACTCIGELNTKTKSKIIELGLEAMMASLKDKEQEALRELLLAAHARGLVGSQDFMDALAAFTVQLEDLAMDVPKAPQLLGSVFGASVALGICGLDQLAKLLVGEASVEPKRRFAATALRQLKAFKGQEWLVGVCGEARLQAAAFLTGDPEFDADQPPLEEFLKAEGLSFVPL